MQNLDLITRVGPATSRRVKGPDTTIPFRIEVHMGDAETSDGPTILSLSPRAAADLRVELDVYLQMHGFR